MTVFGSRPDSRAQRLCLMLFGVALLGAQQAVAERSLSCFDRHYSEAHLATHPAQSVRRITVAMVQEPGGGDWAQWMGLRVVFAPQGVGGQNVRPGRDYEQMLRCYEIRDPHGYPGWVTAGTVFCAVDGDGGAVGVVSRTTDGLLLETSGLRLGAHEDTDAPPFLTAEGASTVRFRLSFADPSHCLETW